MSHDAMVKTRAFDADWRAGLTCHIEIEVMGDTEGAASKETARVLRELADKIDADSLDTGSHAVTSPDGTEWGHIYLDHFAQMI